MSTRRRILGLPFAAAALAAQTAGRRRKDVLDEYDPANIKLSHRMPIRNMSDDDLLFLQQLGIRWCRIEFGTEAPYDFMKATVDRLARFRMKIFSAVHYAYRDVDLQLGRGERDRKIETYCQFLRDCGRLGIPVSNYDWHPANTYTTSEVMTPRGYKARQFKLSDFRARVEKQAFDREYSAEDIWSAYTYFMKAVLPVAEKADVRLALHPDDPPVAMMNGVAKVLVHYDGYRRAEQIAGSSRHWGLTFCVGTWSEGGSQMGKDVFEMIRDFGGRGKLIDIHFRNVSSPMPEFIESFPDDGYMDMYQVMKALRQVKFNGTVVPDHVPQLAGDQGIRRAGTAYCIAYMRALLRRANEEVG